MSAVHISIESAPDVVHGRDPGDDLTHVCAIHLDHACGPEDDCVSFCGISLAGWELIDDDPDAPCTSEDCIVCNAMWEAADA